MRRPRRWRLKHHQGLEQKRQPDWNMPETRKQGKKLEQSTPEQDGDGQAAGCDHDRCGLAVACVACQNGEKCACCDNEQQRQNANVHNACVPYASTSGKAAYGAGCQRTKTERSGCRPVQRSRPRVRGQGDDEGRRAACGSNFDRHQTDARNDSQCQLIHQYGNLGMKPRDTASKMKTKRQSWR